MSLIKSISGIRGTIGGAPGQNLTPIDIVKAASAYGTLLRRENKNPTVVIGRDARISGTMVNHLVINSMIAMGVNVVDLGLSTTPTVEMSVVHYGAQGGIILTASHNPKEWNALKLLDHRGMFISEENGAEIIKLMESDRFEYVSVDNLGALRLDSQAIDRHVKEILALPELNIEAIRERNFHVAIDCINSTGAISLPPLLEQLNCSYTLINSEMHGDFAHNPEPLPAHIERTLHVMSQIENMDLGIVVDPDVDRIAFVDEQANFMGEEYSLVMCADYWLTHCPGTAVSNLSSSIALQDVCAKHGVSYYSSAVGEVNVVNKMIENKAVIGGEGNGGIILPALHYGRDALVGAAIMLSYMATANLSASQIRDQYRDYTMIKDKMDTSSINLSSSLNKLKEHFSEHKQDDIDGLKIYFDEAWVHIRKSNTEPIVRIYAESHDLNLAQEAVEEVKKKLQ